MQWILLGFGAAQASLLLALSLLRYENVHQRTFDLALYARLAWGLARADFWSPITGSHALGVHFSPILLPLGLLGRLFGVVPVLCTAQALCVAACLWPLARIGVRRLGPSGLWLSTSAWLLYPNLGHVATYEFHPGTLAVLPLCWALDALDRRAFLPLCAWCAALLLFREDLALTALLLGVSFWLATRDKRGLVLAAASLVCFAALAGLIAHHAPAGGSLDQHFGTWGGSPLGFARSVFTNPRQVWAHLTIGGGLAYLVRVLAPLSFFSLRAPLLLLPALSTLALNVISVFPTAHAQYSHYLTVAVPALVAAATAALATTRARFVRVLFALTLGIGSVTLGGLPWSIDFERAAFRDDEATRAARAVLAQIPADASVQAPDPLLPHLVERPALYRVQAPLHTVDMLVIDVSHRQRFAGHEDLLRTSEEPRTRTLLARADYGLRVYAPPYALLVRGADGRAQPPFRSRVVDPAPPAAGAVVLCHCLQLLRAQRSGNALELDLRASAACPSDLALRIGAGPRPTRVELPFGGAVSPTLLRAADVLRSRHELSTAEWQAVEREGLFVGALRASGAPPEPSDPVAQRVAFDGNRHPKQ